MLKLISDLFGLTVVDPRAAARRIIGLPFDIGVFFLAALTAITLSALLSGLSAGDMPADATGLAAETVRNPLFAGLAQVVVFSVTAVVVWRLGRLFGGEGSLRDVVAVVAWSEIVSFILRAALAILMFVTPPLVVIASIVATLWVIYVFAALIAEVHGFENLFVVIGVMLLTGLAFSFVLIILFAAFGFSPMGVIQ